MDELTPMIGSMHASSERLALLRIITTAEAAVNISDWRWRFEAQNSCALHRRRVRKAKGNKTIVWYPGRRDPGTDLKESCAFWNLFVSWSKARTLP